MSSTLKVKLWIKTCTLISFVTLGMWSAGNAPKNGEPKLLSLHYNAPAHQSVLVKNFLANNVMTLENPLYSPDLALPEFYLFPWLKSSLKGWSFVLLLSYLRMWQKSWKGFHKMASRNVSNTFSVAGRSDSCTKGVCWRKCILNYCTVLYFSEIKWCRMLNGFIWLRIMNLHVPKKSVNFLTTWRFLAS